MNKKNITPVNEKGQAHGEWELYDSYDYLVSKHTYVNGVIEGWYKYYWSNGNLMNWGNLVNGEQHGYWEYGNSFTPNISRKVFYLI